jgi:hypothetical protein
MKYLIFLISTVIVSIVIDNPVFAVSIDGVPEQRDWFGWAVAAGDFNGDGFDDLAVGVPFEDGSSSLDEFNVGFINVIYGSETEGITDEGNRGFNQGSSGIVDYKEEGDFLGVSLAAGDFDGDGIDDLAIGADDEDLQTSAENIEDHGAVHIIFGSRESGLSDLNNQIWYPGVSGIVDSNPDREGAFGWKVATGDFNNDGADDLAVSAPEEDVEGVENSGAVNVIYGKRGCGLTATGNQVWHQGILSDSPETNDRFGNEISTGDFNGDGFDDLAVGVPWEDITFDASGEVIEDMGAVSVIYGSGTGLVEAGNQLWSEDLLSFDITQQNQGDIFGLSLAAGDFNNDLKDDLAIGAPDFDPQNQKDAGLVVVLYGMDGSGLTSAGLDKFSQPEEVEANDNFGRHLVAGNFANVTGLNNNVPSHGEDLAIGVPAEDLEPPSQRDNAGMVNVMFGLTTDGITEEGAELWHQDLATIIGEAKNNEGFGTVAAGDFNGDGFDDLAVGVYQDVVPRGSDSVNSGAVNIIYANRGGTGLSAEGNQWWFQGFDPDNPP